jgi:hypothetical protein
MKKLFLASCAVFLMSNLSIAQDVNDEALWKYALMSEVIDQMKADLSASVNDLIQKQEGMTGQRYQELAGGAAPDNDFEQQFLDNVNKLKESRIDAIKSVNSDLATKMLGGAAVYKAAKAAAEGDMKDKFEEFRSQIRFAQ